MAAQPEVAIAKNDGKVFIFRCVTDLSPHKRQPAVVLSMPNTSAANALLFRILGQEETIRFSFAIFDDGYDVAGGTHSSTVTSVGDQIRYLKDVIYSHEFDTTWNVYEYSDDGFYKVTDNISVTITDLQVQRISPSLSTGSIELTRGRFVGL